MEHILNVPPAGRLKHSAKQIGKEDHRPNNSELYGSLQNSFVKRNANWKFPSTAQFPSTIRSVAFDLLIKLE